MASNKKLLSTSRTPSYGTPSRSPCYTRAESTPSCKREVLPYAPDAWYFPEQVKIGYEISFTRYFYKPKPMRTLEEIRADILALRAGIRGAYWKGYCRDEYAVK